MEKSEIITRSIQGIFHSVGSATPSHINAKVHACTAERSVRSSSGFVKAQKMIMHRAAAAMIAVAAHPRMRVPPDTVNRFI